TIRAALGPFTGSAALTVTPALLSLAITPATGSIPLGTQQQFTATGTYSDTSTQNVTNLVTWSSSAPAATINAAGLAAGVGVGAATITATLGAITASAALTIEPATLL